MSSSSREPETSGVTDLLEKWDGKHPLTNTWTLWYSDQTKAKEWQNCLTEIASFSTVEDFWSIFNYLKPVSLLKVRCEFYLFKKGIQPMWEDEANKKGGRWDIVVDKNLPRTTVDTYWVELAMMMVGEGMGLNSLVCGAVVSRREACNRLSLWTRISDDREKLFKLGTRIKDILTIPRDQRIFFRNHDDSMVATYRQNSSISV